MSSYCTMTMCMIYINRLCKLLIIRIKDKFSFSVFQQPNKSCLSSFNNFNNSTFLTRSCLMLFKFNLDCIHIKSIF